LRNRFLRYFQILAVWQQKLIKQQQFCSLLREQKWDDAADLKKSLALHYQKGFVK